MPVLVPETTPTVVPTQTPTATTNLVGQIAVRSETEDAPRRLSREQRRQRDETNQGGLDDRFLEGDVIQVSCSEAGTSLTIANVDGLVTVNLRSAAQRACTSVRVGDYVEARGEKVDEHLFDAEDLAITRR